MICRINRKRLLAFDPNPKSYCGIEIGDIIQVQDAHAYMLFNNLVIVTGFSIKHKVIYWKAQCRKEYGGGILHSLTIFDDVQDHHKRYKG